MNDWHAPRTRKTCWFVSGWIDSRLLKSYSPDASDDQEKDVLKQLQKTQRKQENWLQAALEEQETQATLVHMIKIEVWRNTDAQMSRRQSDD